MSLVPEDYVHHFGDLFCFVRRTVDIEDGDVMQEGPGVHSLRTDEISVDEASGCSAV